MLFCCVRIEFDWGEVELDEDEEDDELEDEEVFDESDLNEHDNVVFYQDGDQVGINIMT